MTAWACFAERAGCSRKYSSSEASCSIKAALGLMPPTAAEALQAAFEIFVEVALDGASGDVGVGGDRVMAQAVALEPEDLHLALDAGVGVMVRSWARARRSSAVKVIVRMTGPPDAVLRSFPVSSLCR